MTLSPTYTSVEVATALGMSTWWVQEQVRKGRVDCLRMGDADNARIRFEPKHVDQLRQLLTVPAKPRPKRKRRV